MTALRQAAKMALEALENLQGGCTDSDDGTVEAITVWCPEIIDALREALAQTEQEPTAWRVEDDAGVLCHFFDKELLNYYNKQPYRITPLYLHQAPIDSAMSEYRRNVLLELAEFVSTQSDIDFVVWQLRKMAEE